MNEAISFPQSIKTEDEIGMPGTKLEVISSFLILQIMDGEKDEVKVLRASVPIHQMKGRTLAMPASCGLHVTQNIASYQRFMSPPFPHYAEHLQP